MTVFDDVVLCVLGASMLIGLLRGLLKETLSLLGWVVAFVVANVYSARLAPLLPDMIAGEALRMMAAFVLLFIGVRVLMGILSLAVGALVTASGLGLVDRAMGAVFGLARGCVIVLAAVIAGGMTALPQQAFWKESRLAPLAEGGARAVKPWLPGALAQHVKY